MRAAVRIGRRSRQRDHDPFGWADAVRKPATLGLAFLAMFTAAHAFLLTVTSGNGWGYRGRAGFAVASVGLAALSAFLTVQVLAP